MVELSHWKNVVVPQRYDSGCVPTGYEWLIRYLGIKGIELTAFQEEFDLVLAGERGNDFNNVARKIKEKYPQLNIQIREFPNGHQKIEFIKKLLRKDIPCLLSLAKKPRGSWHIVPVVYVDDTKIRVIWTGQRTGNLIREFTVSDVINRHDNWEGGKDIAWIEK